MREFGRLPDGTSVEVASLGSADGLQAEILTLGATLRSLTFPVKGKRLPLILMLPDLQAYVSDTMYVGQIIGRYANRISGARFELDGQVHYLTANEGVNTLHGGKSGFGRQLWRVLDVTEGNRGSIVLAHRSGAGANGFPGNLEARIRISVIGNTLSMSLEAIADAPTPVNMTWHPYFNLSGDMGSPIGTHRLSVAASRYLPVDSSWLPTGRVASVNDTSFDFRRARTLHSASSLERGLPTLNHFWILDGEHIAAELYSEVSGVGMVVRTNLPGLQIYDGFALREQHVGKHALCLEPGTYPDAPNQAAFPSSVLRPGVTHRSFMSFSFSTYASPGK